MDDNLFFQNVNYSNNIKELFNNYTFKKEMDINIKQILLDREQECTLVFNTQNNECFTDGKIINIGAMDEFKDLDNFEIFALIKGLVGHEASHIRWSNFKDLKQFHQHILSKGYNSNISLSLANILEDGRIERLLCNYLKGYKKYIQYLNLKIVYGSGNLTYSDLLTNLLNTILFLSKLGIYPKNFKEVFDFEQQQFILNEVEPRVIKSVLSNSHKTTLEMTLELLDIISKKFGDITLENLNSELENFTNDNVNPGYSTSEGVDELLKDNKLNSNDILNIEDENISNAHCNDFKMDLNASQDDINLKDINLNELISNLEQQLQNEFNDLVESNNFALKDENNWNTKDNYFEKIDLSSINSNYKSNELKELDFKYEYIGADFKPYPNNSLFHIKILEKQFKKILKNDDFYMKNQRRGRIDSSSLWKISNVHDKNIFSKKSVVENSDYAVYILIDLSGSMNSRFKYKEAINTAIKIEGSLANLNNVEVKTVGFDYKRRSRLRIFKDFKEKKSRTPNALYTNYTGETNRDGFAIRVALDDLKRHSAKNKLLIIISDGRPSWEGESPEESMTDVKNAVHEGRKDTIIMSILINEGKILDSIKDCFYYMYEDKGTIMVDIENSPEELMNNIVLYLKKLFKKR